MSPIITTISPPMELGEGPHWDETTQCLYFVDILKSTIHRFVPETNQYTSTKIRIPGHGEKGVSIIIPVKNEKDKFVITYGTNVVLITWDGVNEPSDYKILCTAAEEDTTVMRMNDGKCSTSGVLFAGSMPINEEGFSENLSNFYVFKNLKPKQLLKEIGISNGLAWTNDEKIIYYNDSMTLQVQAFDYDAENIELCNRRTIFSFIQNGIAETFPDGMTIDADGNLWVACYSGSRVLKIDPKTGTLLDTISFPTPNITSVAFGGKNLDELYVTSGRYQPLNCKIKEDDTLAGCTFKVTGIGSKGIAGVPIDLSYIPQN